MARAAARLTAVATGLDPKGLAVPEVGHLRRQREYRAAAAGFAGGTADGIAAWVRHCCAQWEAGAREGRSIAEARLTSMTGLDMSRAAPRKAPPDYVRGARDPGVHYVS